MTQPSPASRRGIRLLAGCSGGHCPAVYEDDEGDYLVQGVVISTARTGLTVADGEALVRLPRAVVTELLQTVCP